MEAITPSLPSGLFPFLKLLFRKPVNLPAQAPENQDILCSQLYSGEKTPKIGHPVIRVFGLDIVDAHEKFLQLIVHAVQLMAAGQAGNEFEFYFSGGVEDFIAEDHHGLGQVQGGALCGGDIHQLMAKADFIVGEPPG